MQGTFQVHFNDSRIQMIGQEYLVLRSERSMVYQVRQVGHVIRVRSLL